MEPSSCEDHSDQALLTFLQAHTKRTEQRQQHISASLRSLTASATDLSTNLARTCASLTLISDDRFCERVGDDVLWAQVALEYVTLQHAKLCLTALAAVSQQVESCDDLFIPGPHNDGGLETTLRSKQAVLCSHPGNIPS